MLAIGDSDHIGGLFYILENLKIKNVIIPLQKEEYSNIDKLLDLVNEKSLNLIVVKSGDKIEVENDLYFDVLWPDKNEMISDNSINNNSLVCKLNYLDFSVLFTGDIEKEAEEKIIRNYKNNLNILNSTILKVPHHGSNTSSTQEFLEKVNPKVALIGVGRKNKFNHPSLDVIERLKSFGTKICRTDQDGEILITITP